MLTNEMKQVALRILKALDIDEAREVANLIKQNRWDELANTKFNPLHHQDKSLDQFRRTVLAQEFLRKADFLPTTFDVDQVARDGFISNEKQCKNANLHLERFVNCPVLETEVELAFFELVIKARAWIKKTLGPIPESLKGRFGPGATFESKTWRHRESMTAYDKLRNIPHVTQNVSPQLVDHLVWETAFAGAWAMACPTRSFPTTRGNRFVSVPKDATKNRGIAIEAGINMLGQLAVGDVLKLRLKRRGIDLRGIADRFHPMLAKLGIEVGRPWKGQHLHREMARVASVSGSHATIDLSNASDTICYYLVKLLLPDEWFDLLVELRSSHTHFAKKAKAKGRWHRLEKFSSMGNGYTFELETLIFCSLAHAVGGKVGTDSFVYGDDIIIPQAIAADLLAVLRYCGLTPNEKKTFVGDDVYFRESCGGDYFLGADVRPFYIKEELNDPSSRISLANNLWCWSNKWSMPELMAVRASVLDLIPPQIRRCRGPEELGDLVIHDSEDRWSAVTRGSVRYVRVWRPVQMKRFLFTKCRKQLAFVYNPRDSAERRGYVREIIEQDVALTAALIGLPSDGLVPRGTGTTGYRFGRIAYS